MNDFSPFQQINLDFEGRWLITCDHATNHIPAEFEPNLGLPQSEIDRHIAYDIGAKRVTIELARLLQSPAIYTQFSRLVIDPNRGERDPTLVRKLYDGTIIPANRYADHAEITRRLNTYHRPYHDAYRSLAARRPDTVICAVHSFTPQLTARARRPWQIGILSAADKRLTAPLIDAMRNSDALKSAAAELGEPLCIGDNEPYVGQFPGDAIATHTVAQNRPNVLIELRSDLIETPQTQLYWANLIAPILTDTLAKTGL
ncbi:putative N-formylglutamate amidohydrolase [Pacificibacter maritimus]|uniref:Putative N-formylglutamate amidohydrolase n=1 Tax=Pacificibacter maritimus TaxID=762213 RepID=A0A3N4U701_9RHOB|nr:N-formylglutamate amidohydrolase [Pacificibacter maritimus]RPE66232.1 putative N-formylglutamate amidohydrolase [Pacificibacter maritimus]